MKHIGESLYQATCRISNPDYMGTWLSWNKLVSVNDVTNSGYVKSFWLQICFSVKMVNGYQL
jgi:hypothetical protein